MCHSIIFALQTKKYHDRTINLYYNYYKEYKIILQILKFAIAVSPSNFSLILILGIKACTALDSYLYPYFWMDVPIRIDPKFKVWLVFPHFFLDFLVFSCLPRSRFIASETAIPRSRWGESSWIPGNSAYTPFSMNAGSRWCPATSCNIL